MSNSNLYKKKSGTRQLLSVEKVAKIKETPIVSISDNVPSGYTKPDGVLSAALIIIVSGGRKREPLYFELIETAKPKSFPRIKLITVFDSEDQPNGGLSPIKMYEEAKKVKNNLKTIQGINDEIYLVCDVDDFADELLEILPKCKNSQFTLIISNSCFEVWLYYGKFEERPDLKHEKFNCPSNKSEISQAFKTYLGEQVKGGVNPKKALFDIEYACENAKKHYSEDENGIPLLYSTNMFLLAERLIELISPELKKLLVEEEQKRQVILLKQK